MLELQIINTEIYNLCIRLKMIKIEYFLLTWWILAAMDIGLSYHILKISNSNYQKNKLLNFFVRRFDLITGTITCLLFVIIMIPLIVSLLFKIFNQIYVDFIFVIVILFDFILIGFSHIPKIIELNTN